MHAVESKFQPIGNAEFVVNLAQVIFNYLLGRSNLKCYLLVPHASRNTGDDGEFFGRQLWLSTGTCKRMRLRPVCLNDPTHRLIVDPRFAGCDFSYAFD